MSELIDADRADCSVLGLHLYGELLTYAGADPSGNDDNADVTDSRRITYYIEKANEASDMKAIVLDVDSNGGEPVAGEEIANAIKVSAKPVVVFIRQQGLSAAYWAASSADRIFVSKNSDVGSIGVTSSYVDTMGTNAKDGNHFIELHAGQFKDAGNPNKTLTDAEKALWLDALDVIHQNFITDVANNRHISRANVANIADGSSVLGEQAIALKLADAIGGLPEAKAYLEKTIDEPVNVCWE